MEFRTPENRVMPVLAHLTFYVERGHRKENTVVERVGPSLFDLLEDDT